MNQQLLAMMNDSEQALLRDVSDGDLASLEEDDLIELHARVRRARNKYSKLYRRRAGARVVADQSRSTASAANARTAHKAEIFEDALAVVSRQLAKVARASANALKEERLAAARSAKQPKAVTGATAKPSSGGAAKLPSAKKPRRTPATERASAQARAATRRTEAKRASKG